MGKHALAILDWKPHERNSLRGFAAVKIAELRMIMNGVAVHELGTKHGRSCRASRSWWSYDQRARHADGKIKDGPIVEITDRELVTPSLKHAVRRLPEIMSPIGATSGGAFLCRPKPEGGLRWPIPNRTTPRRAAA